MLLSSLPLTAALVLGGAADGSQGRPLDIIDTAVSAGNFTTLVTAIEAAGLVDTLKGDGPFTVFAPTDAAFAKLPPAKLQRLLEPENLQNLVNLLTYHVVADDLFAADVLSQSGAVSLFGQKIDFNPIPGSVLIDSSGLDQADIICSNGVIHAIDTILLPALDDLVETAASTKIFSTLVAAVQAADLVDFLQGDGPYTLFAPTDRAFSKLPDGTLESLLLPENKDQLIAVLQNHLVDGRVYSEQVVGVTRVTTLGGGTLPVTVAPQGVKIDNAVLQAVDIDASNGVVHIINEVLVPAG